MATYEDKPSLAAWNELVSPWVKLVDYTVPSDTAQVNLDVSGIDFLDYARIEFGMKANQNVSVNLLVNDLTTYYTAHGTVSELTSCGSSYMGIFLPPSYYGYVSCLHIVNGATSFGTQYAQCLWSDWRTLSLKRNSGNIPKGTRFVLYGLKL